MIRPAHRERRILALLVSGIGLAIPCGAGCTRREPPDGKLHLTYWEKWERFEGEAMKEVVNAFNDSQDKIVVHYIHSSGAANNKTLLATAGGNPPDAAGLWDGDVVPFAEHGALTPLDNYMKRDGITRDHWIKVYADICTHDGVMWAVPTTPATVTLHWNKALFREAAPKLRAEGFDPDQPPRTIEELDAYARILTKYDDDGDIVQMGFLPLEPVQTWFAWAYGPWFGGKLRDGGKVTANHPRNVAAYEWIQTYTLAYGVEKIHRFSSGFGNFASPQNPFFAGKLAMTIQGVWLHNYISQYAPGMEWEVAPWPKAPHGPDEFTVAQCDVLVIPAGVPKQRADAAWEFLKYVSSQEGMELLCTGQRKNSPLARVSEAFLADHPHPYIELFNEMAGYRNVIAPPGSGIWRPYNTELTVAQDRIRLLQPNPATGKPFTPKEALDAVQERISALQARHQASLALHRPAKTRKAP